uniref:Uncharacterized protein n=1 Tax=viral metagenome TaxID=1070528 RepID=A0A6C0J363_9ZZZZ
MYNLYILFISIISIIINILGFVWIKNLEDISCECSENWMRDYIKYFLITYFVVNIINLLLSIYINSIKNKEKVLMNLIKNPIYIMWNVFVMLYLFAAFSNIFIVINYIKKLKEINCQCSEDIKREIYWYYNIIIASIIALFILLSLFQGIFTVVFRKYV